MDRENPNHWGQIEFSQVPQLYCILPKQRLGTLTRLNLTKGKGGIKNIKVHLNEVFFL